MQELIGIPTYTTAHIDKNLQSKKFFGGYTPTKQYLLDWVGAIFGAVSISYISSSASIQTHPWKRKV